MKRALALIMTMCIVLLFCVACNFEERNIENRNIQEVENTAYSYVKYRFDSGSVECVTPLADGYCAVCDVETSGNFFDLSAKIELKYSKNGNTWELVDKPVYKSKTFVFHNGNDDFYFYGHGNCSELFQIQKMTERTMDVKIYGHDLESTQFYGGGRDVYYNTEDTFSLIFSEELHCFLFQYYDVGTPYRIYSDHMEIWDDFGIYPEWRETYAKDPDDYWWYVKARSAS